MKYTPAQRIQIAQKIADLYASGTYTLESCCKALKVDYDTFRSWAAPSVVDFDSLPVQKQKELKRRGFIHEVHTIVNNMKEIKEVINDSLVLEKASTSLLKILDGYYYKTRVLIYKKDRSGKMVAVGCREYTKYRPPSTLAIIYVLQKHSQTFQGTKVMDDFSNTIEMYMAMKMSDEEIAAEILKHQGFDTQVSITG